RSHTSAAAAPSRAPTPNAAFRFTRGTLPRRRGAGQGRAPAILGRLPASSGAALSRAALTSEAASDRGKEESGTVNAYEIMLILDPELAEERQNEIIARMRELIETRGGSWVGQEPWGRRKLAYEIDKKSEGTYHLLPFDSDAETLPAATRVLKITAGD